MKSLKKGFTLVELMVVIVIIGILAALAIPRFLGATNKTKAAEFKPVLKQIYTLQAAYKQEKDAFSADATGAQIAFDAPSGTTARFSYKVLDGTKALAGTTFAVGAATPSGNGLKISYDGNSTHLLTAADQGCANDVGDIVANTNLSTIASTTADTKCTGL